MELTETLRTFIEEGQDWERKHTSVKGVSIIRLPATKNRPASLAIDINPLGQNGLPMKKKGIMIINAVRSPHSEPHSTTRSRQSHCSTRRSTSGSVSAETGKVRCAPI